MIWSVVPERHSALWLVSALIVTAGRFVLFRQYAAADETRKLDRTWGRLMIAGNLVSGLFWGALPVFLFPAGSMPYPGG